MVDEDKWKITRSLVRCPVILRGFSSWWQISTVSHLRHSDWLLSCGCVSVMLSFKLSSRTSTPAVSPPLPVAPLWSCSSLSSWTFIPSAVLPPLSSILTGWEINFCRLMFSSSKCFCSSATGPFSEKKYSRYAWAYWSEVIRSRLMFVDEEVSSVPGTVVLFPVKFRFCYWIPPLDLQDHFFIFE